MRKPPPHGSHSPGASHSLGGEGSGFEAAAWRFSTAPSARRSVETDGKGYHAHGQCLPGKIKFPFRYVRNTRMGPGNRYPENVPDQLPGTWRAGVARRPLRLWPLQASEVLPQAGKTRRVNRLQHGPRGLSRPRKDAASSVQDHRARQAVPLPALWSAVSDRKLSHQPDQASRPAPRGQASQGLRTLPPDRRLPGLTPPRVWPGPRPPLLPPAP